MAQHTPIISESMTSSECDSFRSPSMSFVVIEDNRDRQEPDDDDDFSEDEDLLLIRTLSARVRDLNGAVSQCQKDEQIINEEKEQLSRRIQQLEEQKANIELNLRREIQVLQDQVEEAKNSTLTTSASYMSANPESEELVDQLTLENTELKRILEDSSSSSRLMANIKSKQQELKTKKQEIAALNKEKEDLEFRLRKVEENARNEQTKLQQQIDELSSSRKAPNDNMAAELRDREEELKEKNEKIAKMQEQKDELELLLIEASDKEDHLQERITELEKSKDSSPSNAPSGELRAKEQQIAKLLSEKAELESLLSSEQENGSKERETLKARIAELMKDPSSNSTALSREEAASDERCVALQHQIAQMKTVYEDQLMDLRSNHEVDIASMRQQIADMTKRHDAEVTSLRNNREDTASLRQQLADMTKRCEAEMASLRKNHDDAFKEQQARAKTEINQLKRELSLCQRNTSPEETPKSEELQELRGLNERLENKLREYEISNNKLTKKKSDLLTEMRTLRADKARLTAEMEIIQRQTSGLNSSEEVEQLRERVSKFETECENYEKRLHEADLQIRHWQEAAHESRVSSNRSSKDSDDQVQNLMQIYNSISQISLSHSARRKEERPEKKSGRALTDTILRLTDTAARAGREQNELLELALKEKNFEKTKRREAERKLVEGKVRASEQLVEACHRAKQELAAQFAEHASYQREFIDFLQTRLELVTSPSFQQRMQPVPAYNGCSHFVGQPLQQP